MGCDCTTTADAEDLQRKEHKSAAFRYNRSLPRVHFVRLKASLQGKISSRSGSKIAYRFTAHVRYRVATLCDETNVLIILLIVLLSN